MTNSLSSATVDRRAAEIAARLNPRIAEISELVRDSLAAEIAELRVDPQMIELLGGSVEGNVDTILHTFRYNLEASNLEAPAAAMEYARRLAQRGVPVNALVRAYRLGQSVMLQVIFDEIRTVNTDPELSLLVMARMVGVASTYIDRISQQVVVAYEHERERWLANRNTVRAVRVRELIAGDDDIVGAEAAIGYPLRRNHVAMVLWLPNDPASDDSLATLERIVDQLAARIGVGGDPLFVAADQLSGWAWIAVPADAEDDEIALQIRDFVGSSAVPLRVAVGPTADDSAGFRVSHLRAQQARVVATAAEGAADSVIAWVDPGLSTVALLANDLSSTRDWVRNILGPLGENNENSERLRETLRMFLATGSSNKAAAELLHLHYNTVKYRVQKATEQRGKPIASDRLDVELALLLCHWLRSSVLST